MWKPVVRRISAFLPVHLRKLAQDICTAADAPMCLMLDPCIGKWDVSARGKGKGSLDITLTDVA